MAEDTNKNKNKKHFFKDMKTELKKVTWLTPKQLLNNTVAVVVMVIIVTAIVFVLDFTFETLNSQGVEKLKSIVQQDETNTIDNTVTDGSTTENTVDNTVTNSSATENTVNSAVSGEGQTTSNEVQE